MQLHYPDTHYYLDSSSYTLADLLSIAADADEIPASVVEAIALRDGRHDLFDDDNLDINDIYYKLNIDERKEDLP